MEEIPDVIQAKLFQLVDDSGNVTAELKTHQTFGTPTLGFRDHEGNVRLVLTLNDHEQPFLLLYNENAEIRLFAGVMENGEPILTLFDGYREKRDTASRSYRGPYRPPKASSDGQKAPRRRWWWL